VRNGLPKAVIEGTRGKVTDPLGKITTSIHTKTRIETSLVSARMKLKDRREILTIVVWLVGIVNIVPSGPPARSPNLSRCIHYEHLGCCVCVIVVVVC
jgi:hypothetical protein